ncbi:MAG: Uma2 family endonuclease [Gammaproteobacteria bacterium]|jgi:Uma2 family endonuclease|nr:Uma2 family endonuclease [Gammaproteobacteria bacterium]
MIQLTAATAAALPGRIDLAIPPAMRLDDDLLFAFCAANRDLRIERNADGDLEIMPPTGAETGHRNAELALDFGIWARQDGRGVVFDSSIGFLLPNGAMRSPDLAWLLRERLAQLSAEQKRKFLPLVPDLVVELASPSDAPEDLHAKLREWRDNGARLGWLILPDQREVWRYTPAAEPERLDEPDSLDDPELLPGLALPMTGLWSPAL